MKASTYKTKLAMALTAVVSLSMVTTGCKTSSKKKAAVAAPSPTVIPPPQPAPPVDTSTSTSVATPVGGVTCETSGVFGKSKKTVKIDINAKRMSITDVSNTVVYYILAPTSGFLKDYTATVDPIGLGNIPMPTVSAKLPSLTGTISNPVGSGWYLRKIPFLTSQTGQAAEWNPINIIDGCQ